MKTVIKRNNYFLPFSEIPPAIMWYLEALDMKLDSNVKMMIIVSSHMSAWLKGSFTWVNALDTREGLNAQQHISPVQDIMCKAFWKVPREGKFYFRVPITVWEVGRAFLVQRLQNRVYSLQCFRQVTAGS